MRYCGTLVAVKDMAVSRKFYEELLGLKVAADYGANVAFRGGVSLQTVDSWADFIEMPSGGISVGSNDMEFYFEENNLDRLLAKLESHGVDLVHGIKEHSWGQRAIRFYDPDRHIIEVGESMRSVVKRLLR